MLDCGSIKRMYFLSDVIEQNAAVMDTWIGLVKFSGIFGCRTSGIILLRGILSQIYVRREYL